MSICFVEVTPEVPLVKTTASAWETFDLSATIPSGATFAVLYIKNTTSTSRTFGARANGETKVQSQQLALGLSGFNLRTIFVPLSAARKIEVYSSSTSLDMFLVGYLNSSAVQVSYSPIAIAANNIWQTVSLSSYGYPKGAIFETYSSSAVNVAFRKAGTSSDLYSASAGVRKTWFITPLSQNCSFEVKCSSNIANVVNLIGVINKGFYGHDNPIVRTPSTSATWVDLPVSSYGNFVANTYLYQGVEVIDSTKVLGVRKKGIGDTANTSNTGRVGGTSQHLITSNSSNNICQANVDTTGSQLALYEIGYFSNIEPQIVSAATPSLTTGFGSVLEGLELNSANSARIKTGTKTLYLNSFSNTDWNISFTVPELTNFFSSGSAIGPATLEVLNSSSAIIVSTPVTINPPEQYGYHKVTSSVSNNNIGSIYYAQTPAIKANDVFLYDSATATYAWSYSITSDGYMIFQTQGATSGTDNVSYRIYSSDLEQWSTPGTVTIQSPYINARANSVRVAKSVDGKRYSRYVDGSGPRYNPTIIVRSQAELNSALSLSEATLSGQVIGVEYNTTPYFIDDTIILNKTFSSGLTICQYGSRMPQFNFIRSKGLVNTKFSGLDLYRNSNGTCFIINSGTDNITIEYCKIHSTYWDPNGNYGAYEPSSNQATGLSLTSSGAGANIANVYIMNNQIYNVLEGLNTSQGFTGDFHFIGNEVYNMYTGGLQFSPQYPNTGTTKINWNLMYSPYGKSTDTNIGLGTPPHVDFIQPRVIQKDWTLDIIGNILIPGNSRGGNVTQCIFMDDNHVVGDNTHFYTANVIGNLCVTNSTHAISILQSKNSRVIGNSVIPASSDATIGAKVSVGTGTTSFPDGNGGGNIVKNTVAHTINGSSTETNNYEYNSYSAAVLATLFVGPTFSGSTWYTKQAALSAASMLVGGPLDLATNIGSVGTGYVDFTNRTINTSME